MVETMLNGFLSGIIVGGVLSLFGVDHMFIEVMQNFTSGLPVTTSHYYMFFGFIGLLGGAFKI